MMRPEISGQHTLRSAPLTAEMRELSMGNCNRCGFSTTPYKACGNCSTTDQAMGSGMQDSTPLSSQIE